jgi:hypothetical protein
MRNGRRKNLRMRDMGMIGWEEELRSNFLTINFERREIR